MLFIQYRVDFMLLLAQTNTFASWISSRAAVQSIKTEEKANVVYAPVSPWRAKIINLGLSCKKSHKGSQTLQAAGDGVMPRTEAGSYSDNSSYSRTGEGIPGLQLRSVNCPHGIKELHSLGCAIKTIRLRKLQKLFLILLKVPSKEVQTCSGKICALVLDKNTHVPNILQNLFGYSLGFKKMKLLWSFHNHYCHRCLPDKCFCIK